MSGFDGGADLPLASSNSQAVKYTKLNMSKLFKTLDAKTATSDTEEQTGMLPPSYSRRSALGQPGSLPLALLAAFRHLEVVC